MAKKAILIVTNELDTHAGDMIILLREMGHQPVRIHTEDFPLRSTLTSTFDSRRWKHVIQTSKHIVDADDVQSVWWRRPEPFKISPELSEDEKEFARKELGPTLNSFWNVLDCYWISFPLAINRASNKLEQLARAQEIGFEIPRTLFTTDPDAVRMFYNDCNQKMIYKTQSIPMPFSGSSKMIYTNLVREEHLGILDTVKTTVCQFQEYIPKRLELRSTVIGNDIFTAEILSQEHERTSLDWRHYDVEVPYRKGSLPSDIAEKCLKLVRSYGLNFGAFDFIVTPDDRYVFLEMNPNGQWMWVEDRVPELKMRDAMAACLIRGSNG